MDALGMASLTLAENCHDCHIAVCATCEHVEELTFCDSLTLSVHFLFNRHFECNMAYASQSQIYDSDDDRVMRDSNNPPDNSIILA